MNGSTYGTDKLSQTDGKSIPWNVGRRLLDIAEVATALHCGRSYAYQLVAQGDIPSIKLGRLTRVRVEDIEIYINRLSFIAGGQSR